MAFGGLVHSADKQTHGVFMEKARTLTEHYFKIKILQQHRLTFPTCIPALAGKIPTNLLEKLGFSGAFNAFLFGPGFWEFTRKSREHSGEQPIRSEIKKKKNQETKEFSFTGGSLAAGCFVFQFASFFSLMPSVLSQLWLEQPALSWHAGQLGITQHHLNLCTCWSRSKCFFVKEFPIWV